MKTTEVIDLCQLIDLIPQLSQSGFGQRESLGEHAGTAEDPIPIPHVIYKDDIDRALTERIYKVVDTNPSLNLTDYVSILEANGLEWSDESLRAANVAELDQVCILAMLVAAVRADRFSEGILLRYLEDGLILQWIKRLAEVDE